PCRLVTWTATKCTPAMTWTSGSGSDSSRSSPTGCSTTDTDAERSLGCHGSPRTSDHAAWPRPGVLSQGSFLPGRAPAPRNSSGDGAAAGFGGVTLLVGAVRRAHERSGEDRAEAERLALLAEPAELVGVHPAVDRRVLRRRLQVLADGHDVDAARSQVAHRVDDLVVRLAEADDDPGLREHV